MGMMRKVTLFLSLFSLLFLLAACQSAGSSVSGAVSSGNTSSGATSSPSTSGSSSSNGSASSGGSSAPSGSGSASSGTDSSQPPAQSGDASQSSSQSEPQPQPEPEPVKPSNNHTLYILMYHSVVDGDGSNCNDWMTTTQRFREDLQWLKDHGYTTLLPSELENGASLPEKAVLITFDDGYANNYTQAFPVLKEFQAKAVISMIVRRTVDGKPDFLTWDMCREMADSGLVEIGSHTYDHHANDPRGIKRMNGESRKDYEARIFSDLEKSISLIEENVGKPVTFFAYPHGQTEPWASDFLKEHFAMTVTTQHGPANVSHGLYDLSRHNINFKEPLSKYLPA